MKFNTAYHREYESKRVCFDGEETLTEQSHKGAVDVNGIVSRYQRTGVLEHRDEHRGQYGYASSASFMDAMEIVAKGKTMFAELPSKIRNKFNNDPAQFLAFVQDPKNADEMVKLGLATAREDIASKVDQDVEYIVTKKVKESEKKSSKTSQSAEAPAEAGAGGSEA